MITTEEIQTKINNKTKPIGSLGELERIGQQICEIQNTLSPQLNNPHILVFASDHGVAKSGVSAYPQEVTYQMVFNFLQGGAAINVFSNQNGIELKVIDAGVNFQFEKSPGLLDYKVGLGTKSFVLEKAMTEVELEHCLVNGEHIIQQIKKDGCNVVGFGEMGIGNTSSASLLMHKILDLPLAECVGKGTGVTGEAALQKMAVLTVASETHKVTQVKDILQTYGGFEIATMVGAMVEASKQGMVVLVDGFISTAAYLVAERMHSGLKENSLFCHQSQEQGHQLLLQKLGVNPILKMDLRLGEGTGCALAYPLIKSAVAFINEMASFDSAGVSKN